MTRALPAIATLAAVALTLGLSGNANAGGPAPSHPRFHLPPGALRHRVPHPLPLIPPGVRCNGPDLAIVAVQFHFSHVYNPRERSPHADYIIVPVVKNIGSRNWHSNPNQQGIFLDFVTPGNRVHHATHRNFPANMRAGQSGGALKWPDHWIEGTGEFREPPHGYHIYLSYDPDIYIDGNPANNDCNQHNNSVSVSADQMHHAILSRRRVVTIRF